ncbi:MAG: hypothetical protein SH850_04515 [Planctomycetaceae bacterium]|nr:hypothetical protein [Planctomycetaceae bacterium]
MSPISPNNAEGDRSQRYLKILVGIGLAQLAISVAVISSGLYAVSRVSAAVEQLEQRFQRNADAGGPLGRAAVEKGQGIIDKMGTEELSDAATQGDKENSSAVKRKVLDLIKSQGKQPVEPAP